jgi:hypothetical protein
MADKTTVDTSRRDKVRRDVHINEEIEQRREMELLSFEVSSCPELYT